MHLGCDARADAGKMEPAIVEVVTRCDDDVALELIANALVAERIVACAHVRGPVKSVYRWKGVVTHASEWELDAVTTPEMAAAARARIAELHPYETPALVTRECSASLTYAMWVRSETSS